MFKKSKLSIGLDIGSNFIKAVKIEKSDKYLVKDFIIQKIQSQQNLSVILKEVLEKIKAKDIPLNISLSGQNVVCRYATIPLLSDLEFKNSLKFEITKYTPFLPADIYFDGYILRKDEKQNKMLVVIVAVKKEYLNQRLKLMKEIGYELNVVDIDCLALVNCFNFNFSKNKDLINKTVALLNIGDSLSNLNILEKDTPLLSRDIRIGGKEITSRISLDLSCSLEEAERIKIKATSDKEELERIKPSLENVLSFLAHELRISFDYYESQSASTVEKLYLCGGQVLLKDIKDILANYLGIETEIFEPLEGFVLDENLDIEKIKVNSLQLAVALGLALR